MGSFSSSETGLTVNSTAPVSPNNGDIWSDSNNNKLYVYETSNEKWAEIQKIPVSSVLIAEHDTTIANYDIPNAVETSGSSGTPASNNSTTYNNNTIGPFSNAYTITPHTFDAGAITTFTRIDTSGNCRSHTSTIYVEYSSDGSSWTVLHQVGPTYTNYGALNLDYDDNTLNITARYVRVRFYLHNGGVSTYGKVNSHTLNVEYLEPLSTNLLKDDSTTTDYITNTQANPYITLDRGSSGLINSVALYYKSANTTETQIQIQTSTDNATWTTKRTISISKLNNDSWNYIRINPTTARYVRVYGSSGDSSKLGINEIKSVVTTTSELSESHSHGTISTTSTSLGLDGT